MNVVMKRLRITALTVVLVLGASCSPGSRGSPESDGTAVVLTTDDVGALVRVMLRISSPEWRIGMFQRFRVEPPCYAVLFSDGARLDAGIRSRFTEFESMQVHRFYNGRDRTTPHTVWTGTGFEDDWREVALDSLRHWNERQCGRTGDA